MLLVIIKSVNVFFLREFKLKSIYLNSFQSPCEVFTQALVCRGTRHFEFIRGRKWGDVRT